MKKVLFTLLSVSFFLAFTSSASAITVESQSDKASMKQVFVILADDTTDSSAVQLRLEIEGGTVTGFTSGDDGVLSIGTCDLEYNKYTPTTICVDIASVQGYFEAGDVLGVFNVERDTDYGQLKVYKSEGNAVMTSEGAFAKEEGLAFMLFGSTSETEDREAKGVFGGVLFLIFVGFMTGTVFGTTFTTLSHVLQHGKQIKKN
jgi:hypothetical protein